MNYYRYCECGKVKTHTIRSTLLTKNIQKNVTLVTIPSHHHHHHRHQWYRYLNTISVTYTWLAVQLLLRSVCSVCVYRMCAYVVYSSGNLKKKKRGTIIHSFRYMRPITVD